MAALATAIFATGACQSVGDAPQVVKIGVIAPFEGVGRQLGYAILPDIKRELASANRERLLGNYRVALVALNDDLDPEEAAARAGTLAMDPDILAVIGPWSAETAASAAPRLEDAGVPTLMAVPGDAPGPTTRSLCPEPSQIAAELLRGVRESGVAQVVVSGPDTTLRRALLESDPHLVVVADTAPGPCPTEADSDCAVIHAGDAVEAAETVHRWRASGWEGPFLGGPEIVQPWFLSIAGEGVDGARAVVCSLSNLPAASEDVSLQYSAELASAAARWILAGLGRAIADAGPPTRVTLANALAASPVEWEMAWTEVRNGTWVPLRE